MIVQRFLHWLETAPNSSRADAAAALARASLTSDMPEQERQAAEAALTLLLDDPSKNVRLAMADALANAANAPRHLIMALVRDEADIAMQVLCRSPIFLDCELIEIIDGGNSVSLIAIACRQPLSSTVASAIIAEENQDACLALLQNPELQLLPEILRQMADKLGSRAEIRDCMLQRQDLPAEIRQTLIAGLSSALEHLVVEKSWLAQPRAKKIIQDARDRATEQLAIDIDEDELPGLVEHLRRSGQLTTAFLLRAICGGNIALFIAAIANLGNVPERRIRAVFQQGRTAAFRAIYDRTGLPVKAIPAITAAVDIWREEADSEAARNDAEVRSQAIARIISLYKSSTAMPDEGLLALLQRISAEATRDAALMRLREFSAAA